MSGKDIIDNIMNKDYVDAKAGIETALHQKIFDAFDTIKVGIGAEYSGYDFEEEDLDQ